jgi:threonine dehydrogenase-like Zn-dependent dehydrogenase
VYLGIKKVDFPFIGGHELAGTIIAMGKNVDKRLWHIGDTVVEGNYLSCKNCFQCKSGNEQNCEHFDHSKHFPGMPYKGMGGLSSHILARPETLFHYRNIKPEEAAITEPVSCVVHSIETADPQFGDFVLIIGCGIMGLLHVQLAARKGAVVIVSDVNEDRTALALTMGAKYRINPKKENLVEKLLEITGSAKAQVVFDTTPIADLVPDAIQCLGNNGKMVLYSSFYPDVPVSFSPDGLHKGALHFMGTANSNSRDFIRAARLLSEGIVDVKPLISEVYDVDHVKDALESASRGDKFRVLVTF